VLAPGPTIQPASKRPPMHSAGTGLLSRVNTPVPRRGSSPRVVGPVGSALQIRHGSTSHARSRHDCLSILGVVTGLRLVLDSSRVLVSPPRPCFTPVPVSPLGFGRPHHVSPSPWPPAADCFWERLSYNEPRRGCP
jgi:hypothetical protein